MENGSVTDNMINASSTHAQSKAAWGRLHCSQGSWVPNTDAGYQWFQVNFAPHVKLITHIATQGNGNSWWWVEEYYVMYKTGRGPLKEHMENNQRVVSKILVSFSFLIRRLKMGNYLGISTTDLNC